MGKGKVLFLGTGNPEGVPSPFCSCRVCENAEISRLRASILVDYLGDKYLVDAGPDLRAQLLKFGVKDLAGVLVSHVHYDHIGGVDDLRAYRLLGKASLPVVVSSSSYTALKKAKPYLFEESQSLAADLDFCKISDYAGEGRVGRLPFRYYSYLQNNMVITGYRFGNFAYCTDMQRYDEGIFSFLEGVETLVLSVTYHNLEICVKPFSHLTMDEALEFFYKSGVKKLVVSHIGHVLQEHLEEYQGFENVSFAKDGQEVEIEIE